MNQRRTDDRSFLRDLDRLAQQWRATPGGTPPAEMDAAVLAGARAAARSRRRLATWWAPLALAATVIAAFALVLHVQQEAAVGNGGGETAAPFAAGQAPAAPPAPERARALAPAADATALQEAASVEGTPRPDPAAWLSRIETLEAEGRVEEAAAERARLEAAWPGWLAERARNRD